MGSLYRSYFRPLVKSASFVSTVEGGSSLKWQGFAALDDCAPH